MKTTPDQPVLHRNWRALPRPPPTLIRTTRPAGPIGRIMCPNRMLSPPPTSWPHSATSRCRARSGDHLSGEAKYLNANQLETVLHHG